MNEVATSEQQFSGSKTLLDGTRVSMTPEEAKGLWEAIEASRARDAALMPDSAEALSVLCRAKQRLGDLGWREAIYCPKDGSQFAVMQFGSTGIFGGFYRGEWPTGWIDLGDSSSRPEGCLWKALDKLTEAERTTLERCEADHAIWMEGQMRIFAALDLSDTPTRAEAGAGEKEEG